MADVGKFKGPVLCGLAAYPLHPHNGIAASLAAAVNFHDTRFTIGFSARRNAISSRFSARCSSIPSWSVVTIQRLVPIFVSQA